MLSFALMLCGLYECHRIRYCGLVEDIALICLCGSRVDISLTFRTGSWFKWSACIVTVLSVTVPKEETCREYNLSGSKK